jgi:hypothetical protein
MIDALGLLDVKFEFSESGSTLVTDSTSPAGHAWTYAYLAGANGAEWYTGAAVDCKCVPCSAEEMDDSPILYPEGCFKVECTIRLKTYIRIHERFRSGTATIRDLVYGHEQLHVRNDRKAAKNGSAALYLSGLATICYPNSLCEREAAALSVWQTPILVSDLATVVSGSYDGGGHYMDPVGPQLTAGYTPIGTMPPPF